MKNQCLSAATIGLSFALASTSLAAFTSFKSNANEVTIADVLEQQLGGEFKQDGVDFVSEPTTVTRIDDTLDQRWTGTFAVQIVGRFSGYTQDLGVAKGGEFQSLLNAEGLGFEAAPQTQIVTLDHEPFLRAGNSGTHSSIPDQNADERDHLITYTFVDESHAPVWLLFWEDLDMGPRVTKGRSTSDFNDLVVLVRGATGSAPPPIPVPLPPAFWVGAATLAVGAYFARRRVV